MRRSTASKSNRSSPARTTGDSRRAGPRRVAAAGVGALVLVAAVANTVSTNGTANASSSSSTVARALSTSAISLFTNWQTTLHNGENVWVPDPDPCSWTWSDLLSGSETKNGSAYSGAQKAALYDLWLDDCGGPGWDPPTDPPSLPGGDLPVPSPDAPDPLCMGFPCDPEPEPGPAPENDRPGPILCDGVGCGWPEPAPPPGDGQPSPLDLCMGVGCPDLFNPPPPPPSPPGPNPWELCNGIGCPGFDDGPGYTGGDGCDGGGGCLSIDPEDCGQAPPGGTPPLSPPSPPQFPPSFTPPPAPLYMGGPGSPVATPYPVSFAYGTKHESTVDLVVALTGRDFVLSRSYSSKPDMGGSNLIGANWSLNIFQFLEEISGSSPSRVRIATPAGGGRTFEYDATSGFWLPPGPSSQYVIKSTLSVGSSTWPTWRLIEPGRWSVDFYRDWESGDGSASDPDDYLHGLVLQIRDVYETNKKTFTYYVPNDGNGDPGSYVARVETIWLNGDSASNAAAGVYFTWHELPDENLGRLESVVVKRDLGGTPTETQKVEYTYKTTGDGHHASVGTEGDLIQVVKSVLVDRAPSGSQPWHAVVTQYRYHGGTTNESGTDTDSDGFAYESGSDHQLKLVLMPEQIEFGAQKDLAGSGSPIDTAVRDWADDLLDLADGATAFTVDSENFKVMDMAAKVVETYEASTGGEEGRVLTQHLQSACGCSSGSAQGLELAYSYSEASSPDSDYASTTRVEYWKDGDASPFLTYVYDLIQYDIAQGDTEAPSYYLQNMVVEKDAGARWVVRAEYDGTTHARIRMISPSAVSNYQIVSGEPVVTKRTTDGLVIEYDYTSDFRLTKTTLRKGTSGEPNVITETTYGDSSRPWLPTKLDMYRAELFTTGGNTSSTDRQTTILRYGFHSGDQIAWIETEYEAEAAGENGPGGSHFAHSFFDTRGRNHWTRQGDDVLIKRTYDDDTGAVVSIEANVGTTGLPSHSGTTGGSWSGRNASGGSLTTSYTYDRLGRILSMTTPSGVVQRYARELKAFPDKSGSVPDGRPGILYFAQTTLPFQVPGASPTAFTGPAAVHLISAGSKVVRATDHTLTSATGAYGSIFSGYDFDLDTEIARATVEHSLTGLVNASTIWHDLAEQGDGGGRYTTEYSYDDLGRLETVTEPNDNVTKYLYDARSRVAEIQVGVDGGTLQTVTEYFYDSGGTTTPGVGDGVVTLVRQHTGETANPYRDTKFTYDYRSRLVKFENAAAPHAFFVYDNLNRVTKAALFSSLPTGSTPSDIDTNLSSRGIYAETGYSQRGLPYVQRIALDPSSTSSNFLETHTWYDPIGRVVAAWGPNAPGTKVTYNALGQITNAYVTDRGGDGLAGSGSHAHVYASYAANLTDDVVFEETEYDYRTGEGLLDLVTTRIRAHDTPETKTGALSAFTGGDADYVITSFTGAEYDTADRVVGVVDFGTNQSGFASGGSAPTLNSATPPQWNTSSDDIRVTMTYDGSGHVETMTDPLTRVTKLIHDAMGRQVATIENYQNAVVSWSTANSQWQVTDATNPGATDEDRVTSVAYLITQNKVKQVAHELDGTGADTPQVTEYRMAASDGESSEDLAAPSGLVRRIVYPDTESTLDDYSIVFAYNRLGEARWTQDQNGTQHELTRDVAGRVTLDEVAAFGTDIDQTIDQIAATYDSFGRPSTIRSKDGSTVKNAVQITYTDTWQIEDVIQAVQGDIQQGTPRVTYGYATSHAGQTHGNFDRVSSVTYPDGSVVDVVFEPDFVGSHTPDYRISRAIGLKLDGAQVVGYEYLGLGAPAVVDYPVPDVRLDRSLAFDGSTTTGSYPGLDRFGRVVRHTWADGAIAPGSGAGAGYPTIPPIVSLGFSYDKNGNILEKWDARPGAKRSDDWEYELDDLDRLAEAKKGQHGSTYPTVAGSQQWALDVIGNWDQHDLDLVTLGSYGDNGDTRYEGTFTAANELDSLDETLFPASPTTLDLVYDNAGNLREQPLTTSLSRRFTHDAWGRLVKVETGSGSTWATKGEYEYNGLSMRCVKRLDDPNDPTSGIDEQRLLYYSGQWQIVAEHIDDGFSGGSHATDRIVQHVWGLRFIDDLVLSREDANADGDYEDSLGTTADSTRYALTDHQSTVIALISDTGTLLERVTYTPYGEARHQWRKDVDGDGDVDSADQTAASAGTGSIWQSVYNVDADLDRDGDVDRTDTQQIGANSYMAALAPGVLSAPGVGNTIGFCGYVFNPEIGGSGIYTVRFRHYDPALGRWLERDPAGYVDSMSLYGYGWGQPLGGADPYGLGWGDFWGGVVEGAAGGLLLGAIAATGPIGAAVVAVVAVAAVAYTVGDIIGEHVFGDGYTEEEWSRLGGNVVGGAIGGYAGGRAVGALRGRPGRVGRALRGFQNLQYRIVNGVKQFWNARRGHWVTVRRPPGAGACFVAGTCVLTAAGPVPIEQIDAGDQVWAVDAETGEWSLATVLGTSERLYSGAMVTIELEMIDLEGNVDYETVACTAGHPFLVSEGDDLESRPEARELTADERGAAKVGRWTEARWLRIGDRFKTKTGYSATVVGLTIRLEREKVHNLLVEGEHTYSVGLAGLGVHNNTCITYEIRRRPKPGKDGATSRHIIERENGEVISVTHQVIDPHSGLILHQHQTHIGRYGGERCFPEPWRGFPTVDR